MTKRFNSAFSTDGWLGLYIAGMLLNLVITVFSAPLSYFINTGDAKLNIMIFSIGIPFLRVFILVFFITAAYTKAISLFINTLSLDGKKFSTTLEHRSFFLFVLSNILISIFTLGIYVPWAYKAIVNKIAETTRYNDEGNFSFNSKASQLLSVVLASLFMIFVACIILVFSIGIVMKNRDFGMIFLLITFVLFFAILAIITFLQVYTIHWFCNIGFSSNEKKVTYSLNINIPSAILFYFGQTILLIITLGFYAGAYTLNVYEYFAMRIEERDEKEKTGRILFIKPLDKGAGFLLLQAILCVLTAGIYTPFAYVEYSKFFINNTYLETKEEQQLDASSSL